MLDDVPIVDGGRPEEFGAIPGMVLSVAVVTDSIPVVMKMREVGLVPVVLMPMKQVTQYAKFVGGIIKRKRGVFRAEGLNLTHLWQWWLEERYCGGRDSRKGFKRGHGPQSGGECLREEKVEYVHRKC